MIDDSHLTVENVNLAILYKCLALLLRYWPSIIVLNVVIRMLVSRTGSQMREILKFIVT
jgi:hypothetical protein